MISIENDDITKVLDYNELRNELKLAFASSHYKVPDRQHLKLSNENIALIMPAWNEKYYGIKHIMAYPNNAALNLPTIHGTYDLYDINNGLVIARINAAKLTALRTAATSMLASSFLKKKARKLLIIGAGVVGEHLVEAYGQYYDLSEIKIWNRNGAKAKKIVEKFKSNYPISVANDIESEVKDSDIISCATHSYNPIVRGQWFEHNTHMDLIGSYKPDMREVDDNAISKASIYIDSEKALKESGDLFVPLKNGIITAHSIKGTLFQLCKGEVSHNNHDSPTVFKSVGHAIEDLAAAIYLYEKLK